MQNWSLEPKQKDSPLNIYQNNLDPGPCVFHHEEDYTDIGVFNPLPLPPVRKKQETEPAAVFCWNLRTQQSLILFSMLFHGLVFLLCVILTVITAHFYSVLRLEIKQNKTVIRQEHNLTCSANWKLIGSNYYYISTTAMSWAQADAECVNKGSSLLIVNDKKEMDDLLPFLMDKPFWIGLKRYLNSWRWIDSSFPVLTLWNSGEPNNIDGQENCVETKSGAWNDLNCHIKINYICKRIRESCCPMNQCINSGSV